MNRTFKTKKEIIPGNNGVYNDKSLKYRPYITKLLKEYFKIHPLSYNNNIERSENFRCKGEQIMLRKIVLLLIVTVGLLAIIGGCKEKSATTTAGYTDVTPAAARDLIDNNPDVVIIDVSPYYSQGHLPGAISYYLADGSLSRAIPSLDKNKTYLVYCHSDSASVEAAEKLVNAGFRKVYRLKGNYRSWVDAGYPVE